MDANRWSSQRRLEAVPWLRKVCHNGSTLLIIVDNDGKLLVNDDFNGLILICGIFFWRYFMVSISTDSEKGNGWLTWRIPHDSTRFSGESGMVL